MKIRTDPLCPKCGEEEETTCHFVGKCSAMTMARYSFLGTRAVPARSAGTARPWLDRRVQQGYACEKYVPSECCQARKFN